MKKIEELQRAAQIIRYNGVEGLLSAAGIVGCEVALGMLITYLQHQHSPGKQWPDPSNTLEAVEEILKENNLFVFIEYSPLLGHGIVFDGNKATYIVDVGKMYQPEDSNGMHLEMWMQGSDDYRIIPAGKYPYYAAYDEIARTQNEAMKKLLEA